MKELIRELAKKIIDRLGLMEVKLENVSGETTFFDEGLGIDSVDILEIVVMLDRDYGVVIDGRELGEKVFINMGTLASFVADNRKF
jgi:acyl carrier protein